MIQLRLDKEEGVLLKYIQCHMNSSFSVPPHLYLAHLSSKLANPLCVYIYLLSRLAAKIHSQNLDPQLQLLDKKQFRVPKG